MRKLYTKKFGAWLVTGAMLLSMVGTALAATQSEAYAANVPDAVIEVDDNILSGSTAAANTYLLAFLGINITCTSSCGTMAQLIFGSDWNENPDPYIANYYYNTVTYGSDSTDKWEGEYKLEYNSNSGGTGPTGGVSNTSTETITVNGVTKICNAAFYYEPDVLFGSSTSSYSTGLEYYQETVNANYNPLQIGGWGTGTGFYAQSDGTFASTVAMANGVYYDAVAIQAWLNSNDSNLTGRYGNIVDAAETYSDFAMGLHYYYQSLVASGAIEPVNYADALTVNSDGTYTLSAGSNRMAQYADGLGTRVTGTYSSIEELAEAVDVIVSYSGDASEALEAAGIKLLTGLPDVVFGTIAQSADNILGLPYFFAFFYEDQLADVGITLTPADVTAYFVKNIYHIKSEYVQDAVTVMMNSLSVDDTVNSVYSDTIKSMIADGEIYYLSLGDEADGVWAAVDLAGQDFTYTENEDDTYSVTGSTCIVANGVNGHDYDDGTVTVAATATQPGVMTYTCTLCGDSYTEVIDPLLDVAISVSDDVDADYADIAQAIAEAIDIDAGLTDAIETAAEALVPDASSEEVLTALAEVVGDTWAAADDGTVTIDENTASVSTTYAVTLNIEVTACSDTGITVVITPTITVTATASYTSGSGRDAKTVSYDATLIEDTELTVSGAFAITISLDDLAISDTDIVNVSVDGTEVENAYTDGSVSLTVNSLPATTAITTTHIHSYGEPTFSWSTRNGYTCTATFTCTDGDDTQTVDCTVDDGVVTTEAVCYSDGSLSNGVLTYTATATFNGETYTSTYEVAITASHTLTHTVTTQPTRYTKGVMTYVCDVCGYTYTAEIATTGATFLFDDVDEYDDSYGGNFWYYEAVYWAYDLNVTLGTTETTFSPTGDCTREQFATFLYRMAAAYGVDVSYTTSNPFSDVTNSGASAVYYDAIMWAYENGITTGTDDGTTFDPGDSITRAQAVTMLYRYATMMNGGTAPTVNIDNPFSDLKGSSVYYNAILWAYENGVTNGTDSTTFDLDGTCERAMMVTFLYRYAANQDA